MKTRPKRIQLLLWILPVLTAAGPLPYHAKSSAAQKGPSTSYYTHGRIYTNDPEHPWAEAMAVSEGRITCIGKMDHVLTDCGGGQEGVDTLNLRGQFVMPGFNDAHVHLGMAAADELAVPLMGVSSPEDMQKRVAEAVAHHKPGEWITGGGWDHTTWPEKRFPNRQQLDAVAPRNPVILTHISGHVAVANSLALKSAEVVKSTPNPPGGEIEHDALGEPTGMLKEDAAMALVKARIPDPTTERRRKGIERVLENVARNGVTSVQDYSEWADFQVYQQLKEEGKLTVRITEWLPFNLPLNELQNRRAQAGYRDPWLKTGALKAFLDGALGSRTAAMLEPYSDDPATSGILTSDPEKLATMAIQRDKAGFQLAFHAIGDRANRIALDVLAAVAKANGPRDRRDRIEHASGRAHGFCPLCGTPRHRFHAALPSDHGHALGGGPHRARAHHERLCLGHHAEKQSAAGVWHGLSRGAYQPVSRAVRLRHARTPRWRSEEWLGAARENLARGLHPRLHIRLRLCAV